MSKNLLNRTDERLGPPGKNVPLYKKLKPPKNSTQSDKRNTCRKQHVLQKKVPFHDLQFCKELMKYKTIDASISKAACGKIKNHLWYLNPENVSLSFFDENILIDDKKEM
ncbi:hypothetical protein NQ317_010049, partial [Molorchus minor]